MLLDRLTLVTDQLRSSVAELDPERLSGPDAARLLAAFAEVERLAAAGKLLSARRVESSNVWRRSGHRSAAAHVAEATGTGIGPAITTLETARHLGSLPATDEAVRQGRLSETQVKEIAGAAILQPEAELSLVEAAGEQPLSMLKLRCKRVRAAGQDPRTSYETIRRGRYFRNWIDDAGAVRFDARLTPDEGARLLASVEAETDRLATASRRAGVDEPRKALAADALVALACRRLEPAGDVAPEDIGPTGGSGSAASGGPSGGSTGSGRAGGPAAVVHVRVDHAALMRGHVEAGELCEIPGIGPIPVEVARRLAADAFLHVLVTDGVDVTAVARGGRTIPAALRLALAERDPECVVPGCDTRDPLEIDHLVPFAEGGEASMANLARLCHWHHYLKTHHGHRLERGGPGDGPGLAWHWTASDEPPVVPRRIRLSG
jgi:5-methylcytosine-specific restriction endonuclease McrA